MLGSCLGPTGLFDLWRGNGKVTTSAGGKWRLAGHHLTTWQTGRVAEWSWDIALYVANFIGKSSPRGCLGLMKKDILIYYSMR